MDSRHAGKGQERVAHCGGSGAGQRWRKHLVQRFRHKGLQQTSEGLVESQLRKLGHLLPAAHARAKERARLLNEQPIAEAAKRRAEDKLDADSPGPRPGRDNF